MKLLFIIWISSTATLFLACGFFIFFEVAQFDKDLIKEIKILSNFITDKSAPAIMFNDPAIAEDALLSAAAIEPAIVNAVIYDAEANVVATYASDHPDHKDFAVPEPQQNTTFIKDAHLHFFGDIGLYSDRVGTLYIKAGRHVLYKRIQRYGVIVASIMAVSLLFIAVISFFLQKLISKPVMALIASAKQVSEKKDYATRVKKQSDDELGVFVDAFNEMLAQIQKSDSALRESRELFAEMASNIPGVIYQFYATPEGVYEFSYVSERAEEILGISSDTNGFYERFLACVADDDRAAFSASIAEAVRAVGTWEFEGKFIKPSGEELWFSGITRSIMKGMMFVANGVVIDITERKRAEDAQRESEERYRILFNSINDAVFVHQPSREGKPGKFIEANDVACQRYGYTIEELLELIPTDLAIPEQKEDARMRVKRIFSERYSVFEIVHKAKDGREIPVEISAHLFDFHGQPTVFSIVRDITDRKRAEEEQLILEAQLQQSQKMESIGTLAGGIAHDFNNLLSVIMGNAEIALYDLPEQNPVRYSIDQIAKAGHRAKDLVKQILAFSRQSEPELRPVRVSLIVKEVMKLLRSSLPSTIEIRQKIVAEKDSVISDPIQIHQILMNLCTNAGYAMRERGGILDVRLTDMYLDSESAVNYPELEPGQFLKLTVSDTGHGMTPDIIERIFDPYFTSKEKDVGTGLGLSVVHGIISSYGGAITVESEPDKGTTFNVFLPRTKSKIRKKTEGIRRTPTGSERVLIVDDEIGMVNTIKRMLDRLGYKVTSRTSSLEALELFRNDPDQFDLVITDMTMPQMTGDKLSKALMEIRPDIPIILCTGFSEQVDEKTAKSMGIRAFVMKPIVMREIANTIREILDKK